MSEMIQPGMHPDADTLTAFAEQQLELTEREEILAHMAACSRCREVVFFARQAAAEETAIASASPALVSRRSSGMWRWAWVPAGALAAAIGVAAVLHFRHAETATEMARNAEAPATLRQSVPTAAASNTRQESAQANLPQKEKPSIARRREPVLQENDALKSLDKRGSGLGKAAPPVATESELSAGAIHGALVPRTQSSSYGGPMANQSQQQNAINQLNLEQSAASLNEKVPDQAGKVGATPGAATETVTVQASAQEEAKPAAPTPPLQRSYTPLARDFGLASAAIQAKKTDSRIMLPGGAALSSASAAGHVIAINSTGTLYASDDAGGHWQPVPTQWTGKAALVRSVAVGAKDGAQPEPSARFELVNEKAQVWISTDGKTWTAKPEAQR